MTLSGSTAYRTGAQPLVTRTAAVLAAAAASLPLVALALRATLG